MCVQSRMVAAPSSLASAIRTSLVVGAATGTMIAAWMMSPPSTRALPHTVAADDGMVITARLVNARILPGAQEHNLAVTIAAPAATDVAISRPPLSLAIVIDRSGSMHGAPIQNAKAAALSVLRQLDTRDAFSVVAYSSSSETVIPM